MQVQYRQVAEENIQDTYHYYLYEAGLVHAKNFLTSLLRIEKRLEKFPESCGVYKILNGTEVRRGLIPDFPHLIFYVIVPQEERVEIVALIHSKQNIKKLLKI